MFWSGWHLSCGLSIGAHELKCVGSLYPRQVCPGREGDPHLRAHPAQRPHTGLLSPIGQAALAGRGGTNGTQHGQAGGLRTRKVMFVTWWDVRNLHRSGSSLCLCLGTVGMVSLTLREMLPGE